jgi:hypothetical protein
MFMESWLSWLRLNGVTADSDREDGVFGSELRDRMDASDFVCRK